MGIFRGDFSEVLARISLLKKGYMEYSIAQKFASMGASFPARLEIRQVLSFVTT